MSPEGGARLAPAQLRTGDVLLMRRRGALAALTAWFGDSDYDHVALIGRAGCVLEFAADGVSEPALSAYLGAPDLLLADARRPLAAHGEALQDNDRIAVLAHALSLRRPQYAGDPLRALGVLAAVRERALPPQPPLRRVLLEALSRVSRGGAEAMTAPEFVYRCFAESPVQPRGRLAPRLLPSTPRSLGFPTIDWTALWAQIAPWLPPERRELPDFEAAGSADEAAFERALAAARSHLGLLSTGAGLLAAAPRAASPKWLRLRELELSPSHETLGRVFQAVDRGE